MVVQHPAILDVVPIDRDEGPDDGKFSYVPTKTGPEVIHVRRKAVFTVMNAGEV